MDILRHSALGAAVDKASLNCLQSVYMRIKLEDSNARIGLEAQKLDEFMNEK
jgi:hypothetical protein